jgi:hypothetical protein
MNNQLLLAFVKWVDTIGDPDTAWKNKEDTSDFFERDDNIVYEVGFVWSEDDDYLCLVSKYLPAIDDELTLTSGRTKIPKKWILERKDFKTIHNKVHKTDQKEE